MMRFPTAVTPIVVTGAAGFVGSHLTDRLRALGFDVVAIDSADRAGVDIVADICDPRIAELIPPNSVVVHLAAMSTDGQCRQNPEEAIRINVQGTLNLARASTDREVVQFIFASSEWVYGDLSGQVLRTEDTPIEISQLSSVYAITKAVTEPLLRHGFNLNNLTLLRFGIVYGPRDRPGSAVEKILFEVLNSDIVNVGSLQTGRRFVHVQDLVEGIIASVGLGGFNVLNLSGSYMITLADIISAASELFGRFPKVIEADPAAWVQRNPSNLLAREVLDWKPMYDLESGLLSVAERFGG